MKPIFPEMPENKAFALELPKWPQFLMTGKDLSPERALEIIFLSDEFLNCLGTHGGNDREWKEDARRKMGIGDLEDSYDSSPEDDFKRRLKWNIIEEWSKSPGRLNLEYIQNTWLSSAWIGGPAGWINQFGEIYHGKNVGKWPSVKDIYDELKVLASTFPDVEAAATLMSGESGDDDAQPVVTFTVKDGAVKILDIPGRHEWRDVHYKRERTQDLMAFVNNIGMHPRLREHGIRDEICDQFFARVKTWVDSNKSRIEKQTLAELEEFKKSKKT